MKKQPYCVGLDLFYSTDGLPLLYIGKNFLIRRTPFLLQSGAPIAQWVKRWPTDLADRVRSSSR